jgi:uncharacterized protein
MNPELFLSVVEKLMEKPEKCIIGPSCDGGFYLFASTFSIPESIWMKVIYSQEDTLAQLLLELDHVNIQYDLIGMLVDCDTISDMEVLYCDLSKKEALLPAQKKIVDWIQKNKIQE